MPKKWGKVFSLLLLVITVFRIGLYLRTHPLKKFNPEAHKIVYLGSVYVRKGGSSIADDLVYGYAAWEYIHGKNPTLINPEMPPLGKYLMGLSILLFQTSEAGSLIFGLLSLVLIFLIGKIILKSTPLSLIPMALFTFEPLFLKQLNATLLDVYHLFFILSAFYFFLLAQKGQTKYYLLASLALGGVLSIKFYSTGLVIVTSWTTYLILTKNRPGLIKLFLSLPLALLVLMASYFRIFLEGESLRRFFGIQKWMFHFHSSGKFLVPPGAIWQLIFLKKWVTWWADRRPLPAPDWQITWPVSIAISLGLAVLNSLKSLKLLRPVKVKISKEAQILLIWVTLYLVSLSFGVAYPRYLLPLLPFAFTISVLAIRPNR